MDWIANKEQIVEYIKKYRFVLLVLLLGLFLMLLPEPEQAEMPVQVPVRETPPSLQESLSEILSHVSGAGVVKVLLTQAAGEETVYQTDDDLSSDGTRRQVVIVTNASREEIGLIRQINPPAYLGAVVLCQGADSATVRLSIVEAVANATGLTSDRITVLKMK